MENEIAIHESKDLKDKIYTIRGVQVMIDADLAQIYGYSTKDFNRQVKNNIDRFDDDFRFQLTDDEFNTILRCKNFTSKTETRGGRQYNPYAFTEQGIYMLMTVLRGELAVAQSKMLICCRMCRRKGQRIATTNANLATDIPNFELVSESLGGIICRKLM